MKLAFDNDAIERDLTERGYAVSRDLITPGQATELAGLFDESSWFRSTVDMTRHGYGQGCYRYFGHPVPPTVAAMRSELYATLLPIANQWRDNLGQDGLFPPSHAEFLARCHEAGQQRPTPLILHYTTGGHNRLHQDRYGETDSPWVFWRFVYLDSSGWVWACCAW